MFSSDSLPCAEATIRSVEQTAVCTPLTKFWTLTIAILGSSIAFLDGSVVNVAMPAIANDLNADATAIQWIVNGYQLPLAALLLVGGAAGDQFGRRRIFVVGVIIFAAASIWCGFSQSSTQLIVARTVQGVGAALLVPSSLAIIGDAFEESERGKAIGTWAAFSALAGAAGPILGGWIVDHTTWHWIFLINPLLALPTIGLTLRHVPESRDPNAASEIDWRGALLAFAGLGCLIFGLILSPDLGWRNPTVIATVVGGTFLLAAFIWAEARSRAPMMPLELFRSRTFSGINLQTLLLYAAMGGAVFFLPFELIQIHGYSTTQAGAAFLPFTLIMGLLSRWSGGLLGTLGARIPLVVGPTIAALAFALLALPGTGGSYWMTFLFPIALLGLGMTIAVAPLTTVVIDAVPMHHVGAASGINNAVAAVARLLAVAVLGGVGLAAYNRGIDDRLAAQTSTETRQVIAAARGSFVAPPSFLKLGEEDRRAAGEILTQSLAGSISLVMVISCGLALAGAVCGAVAAPPRKLASRKSDVPAGSPAPETTT